MRVRLLFDCSPSLGFMYGGRVYCGFWHVDRGGRMRRVTVQSVFCWGFKEQVCDALVSGACLSGLEEMINDRPGN